MMDIGKEEEMEVKKTGEKNVEENQAQDNMVEDKTEEEENKLDGKVAKTEMEGKIEYDNSEKTSDNKVEKIKTEANTESRGKNIIHHHRKKYGNFISLSYDFLISPSPCPIVQSLVPTKTSPRSQFSQSSVQAQVQLKDPVKAQKFFGA